jgi:hypothetical protein
VIAVIGVGLASAVTSLAQRSWLSEFRRESPVRPPVYDGRFMFARVRYTSGPDGYYYRGLPAWAHGYVPSAEGDRAEVNLTRILAAVSYLNPHIEESGVFALDDPELCRYPIAYLAEPGFWTMGAQEAAGLRAYLLKGGFMIFDDFRADGQFNSGGGWANFEGNIRRAVPELRLMEIDASAPIFHAFFEINSFDIIPQSYDRGRPAFFALFEDTTPSVEGLSIDEAFLDVRGMERIAGTPWEIGVRLRRTARERLGLPLNGGLKGARKLLRLAYRQAGARLTGLRQILELHLALAAEQEGLGDHRLELAHVPRPWAILEARQRSRAESGDRQAETMVQLRPEVLDQQRDIVRPFTEWRDGEHHPAQAVVEILSERAGRDHGGECAMGGGDDPGVNPPRLRGPDCPELSLLQKAEQRHLALRRELGHLIEEQRPAMRDG